MFTPQNTETTLTTDTTVNNATKIRLVNINASSSYLVTLKRLQDPDQPENNSSGTFPTVGNGTSATFTVTDTSKVYTISSISAAGTNYAVGDKLLINGTSLAGVSPLNDAFITVSSVGGSGEITGATITGKGSDKTGIAVDHTGQTGSYISMQPDADRIQGVYTDVSYTTSGSGTPGKLEVTVNKDGAITSVSSLIPGINDSTSDIYTIADNQLGNGGASDVTIIVTGTSSTNTYQTYATCTLVPSSVEIITKNEEDQVSSNGAGQVLISKIS